MTHQETPPGGPLPEIDDGAVRGRRIARVLAILAAAIALTIMVGPRFLPPVPQNNTFLNPGFAPPDESLSFDSVGRVGMRADPDRELYFGGFRWPGTYFGRWCLVDLPTRRIIGVYGTERMWLFSSNPGIVYGYQTFNPDTYFNRVVLCLEKVGLPPVYRAEHTQIGLFHPLEGRFESLGAVPFGSPFGYRPYCDISSDQQLVLWSSGRRLGGVGHPAPVMFYEPLYPLNQLVSLKDCRVVREMPIPGECFFLSNTAAICLSPYGVARIDLVDGTYEIVHQGTMVYLLDPSGRSQRYTVGGRQFLGVVCFDPVSNAYDALRIELSDPPRIERLNYSLPDLDPEATIRVSPWLDLSEVNFARDLVILSRNFTQYLVDAKTNRILLTREHADVRFIGNDLLYIWNYYNTFRRSQAAAPPAAAGNLQDSSLEEALAESMMFFNDLDPSLDSDESMTTQTLPQAPPDPEYIQLDDLMSREGGK